jgi:hypothetical protein
VTTTIVADRWVKKRAVWARENTAYLHRLLTEKHQESVTTESQDRASHD